MKMLPFSNWYKQKRGQERSEGCGSSRQENATSREERDSTEPETVIFIPSTPRGELLKLMKESESQFRKGSKIRQIKFVERAGISIQDTLVSSNPWGDLKCGRANCFVCKSERGGISMCMKESVTYSIRYDECKRKERNVEYWGETGRDCFSRGEEHVKGCKEKNVDNPMWKHIWESHEGRGGEELFTMKMEGGFRKPNKGGGGD